jgi:hypothetical protein
MAGGVNSTFTNDGSFGIAVCIDHGTAPWRYSLYAHLSATTSFVGTSVEAGQLIGYSGNTGTSSGAHLHVQVSDSNTFPVDITRSVDPISLLQLEEPMTPEERKMLRDVWLALTAGQQHVLEAWNAQGNSMLMGYTSMYNNAFRHTQDMSAHTNLTPWLP